jgi:adenylate cyclase
MNAKILEPTITELMETPKSTSRAVKLEGLVLVVDDEEKNRMLLRDALEVRGYHVEEAEDGLQALQMIAARPPDVILLDLMMPKMDGYEVCRRLRRELKTAHLPILMITALAERGDRLLGIQVGANDFLNKPIDVQDVILRVGNAIHAKRLFDLLQAERDKTDRLLLNILPKPIAQRMKLGETNIADSHPDVTILVADLVGFTTLSIHIDPEQVVGLLNEIFSSFDELADRHGLEKIKTIGDAYMVVGGLTSSRTDHCEAMAALALDMQDELKRFNRDYETSIQMRIGISTGPVVAGVIGRRKFAYDLWGVTVNVACRLESVGEAGEIQVAESTYERLMGKYTFKKKRHPNLKGHGDLDAYSLQRG